MNKKLTQDLAEKAGLTWLTTKDYGDELLKFAELVAAAEREECAVMCEEVVTHPAGYGGQWEGYGPVKTQRDGKACAAAIRERSNAKAVGPDAALCGRSHTSDGLCPGASSEKEQ